MISVQEASRIIQENILDFGVEKIPLNEAIGRVLKEDLFADRDFPPFNRVTMDGIAIKHQAFENGMRNFKIESIAAAGSPKKTLLNSESCIEVMTGAVLPLNTDSIIRYEDLVIKNGFASLQVESIKNGQNVHYQGTDRKQGDLLVKKGDKIRATEIGIAATIGKSNVIVAKLPRTIIISTGDELVDINEIPEEHQIRKSNVYTVQASLIKWGIHSDIAHLEDELEEIKSSLKQVLNNYDLIILSGGVSMGKFDYLPKALSELGVTELFHKVKQRPGKPLWFGRYKDTCVFALPGNPVSSFMCTQVHVSPWLNQSLGIKNSIQYAALSEDVVFKPDLHYYLQVKLMVDNQGKTMAVPCAGHGSGDLANLVDAEAFLELPQGKEVFMMGEVYTVFPFH